MKTIFFYCLENLFDFFKDKSYTAFKDIGQINQDFQSGYLFRYHFKLRNNTYHTRRSNSNRLFEQVINQCNQDFLKLYIVKKNVQPPNTITCGQFCIFLAYQILVCADDIKRSDTLEKQLHFLCRILKSSFSFTYSNINRTVIKDFSSNFGKQLVILFSNYLQFRGEQYDKGV